tara:strand:- start:135349 stop:135825 length:477 start_codon:yes stop_codon:yes gene_type:complete
MKLIKRILITGLVLAGMPAYSATKTTNFQVTATVNDVCVISAVDLAFGQYDPTTGTANDSTSTVTVTCTLSTAYDIGLSSGLATGATSATRQMGDELNYSMFGEPTRTTNWDNTGGTNTVTGTGTGLPISHIVYGRIPGSQIISAGSYSDTVTVTLSY